MVFVFFFCVCGTQIVGILANMNDVVEQILLLEIIALIMISGILVVGQPRFIIIGKFFDTEMKIFFILFICTYIIIMFIIVIFQAIQATISSGSFS